MANFDYSFALDGSKSQFKSIGIIFYSFTDRIQKQIDIWIFLNLMQNGIKANIDDILDFYSLNSDPGIFVIHFFLTLLKFFVKTQKKAKLSINLY